MEAPEMPRALMIAALSLLASLNLVGCQPNVSSAPPEEPTPSPGTPCELTRANATAAVQAWINNDMSGGSVTIFELHLSADHSSAEAYLRFSNLTYDLVDKGPTKYSGPGLAFFEHYADGRWVLTQVATANGLQSIIKSTIVEVKE
jgi:hypothetical protein